MAFDGVALHQLRGAEIIEIPFATAEHAEWNNHMLQTFSAIFRVFCGCCFSFGYTETGTIRNSNPLNSLGVGIRQQIRDQQDRAAFIVE